MRADEYIVELLNKKEQEYHILYEDYQTLRVCNTGLQDKLVELDKILTSIKQNLIIQKAGDVSVIKYTFVDSNHKQRISRIITFNDEPLFGLLISILGPLKKEEISNE